MSLRKTALALVATALAGAAAAVPGAAQAQVNPAGCTQTISYDPTIPTWEQFFAAHPDPDAVIPLGQGRTGQGGGAPANGAGSPPVGRNLSKVIDEYWDGLVAATATNPRVRIIKKFVGKSATGLRNIQFYVLGTPENIANLDRPDGDAAFWRGVRSGEIPEEVGVEAAGSRPAFAWITATPHGAEPAAGEAITREAYELAARMDCENARRLRVLDYFLQPVRNPDGRDGVTRTTAWTFDPNRDFGTQNQVENKLIVPEMNQYPGVFFIDAHQTSNGYFFPPNEDPVHHEISHFSLDFIQKQIGPGLQDAFNAQGIAFRNYSQYDLFTPEYGDTVPSLIMGAAGMTYEKGSSEAYAKQVYDHYLAIDTTVNVTVNDKINVTANWVRQWQEAIQQGRNCKLQENSLVSPLHDTIKQQPDTDVCGYFFKPDQHTGDLAAMIDLMQKVGVRVYRLDTPVAVNGYHEYGRGNAAGKPVSQDGVTLPAGTLYIPMEQGTKHWIQAVLGENPYIPYDYYYDVVSWSYPLQRGLAGSGFLTKPMAPGIRMTELAPNTPFGGAPGTVNAVYAFNTDSMQGLALTIELLDRGVNVYRATAPFNAGGRTFYTGTALVDGASLAQSGVNLAQLADARDTVVTGLSSYPAARRQMAVPKIGLYTNGAMIPSNPLFMSGPNVSGTSGHCALTPGSGGFCEALFVLAVKDRIPLRRIVPVTSADLTADKLNTDGFTAFINPNGTIATTSGTPPDTTLTPAGESLRRFINQGGIYIGINANGATAPRSVGASTLESLPTQNNPVTTNLLTPGSTFDGTFDTTNPVAWGFDLGGWIYRDSSQNATFEGTTLGSGASVVTFASTPDEKYGYEANASRLTARPAVVDSPYGSGRSVLFGFNPFFRAWKESDERLVLNAVLYPRGATAPAAEPSPHSAAPAPKAAEIKPAAAPLPAARLPEAAPKVAPAPKVTAIDRDVRIQVKRADAAKLKAAVKAARLSRSVKRHLRYTTTRKTVTLVIKGARSSDEHARKAWVSRIKNGLDRRKVKPIYALV